jgi:diguanylate cyclase
MFDIDNFKSVNDSYGHMFGDEVLIAFAGLAKKGCRQYDMVGRYGGEEFLVVLPDIAIGDIGEIADRIGRAIRHHPFRIDGKDIQVTASSGISFCHPDEQEIFAALKRADDGLYLAKRNGKDKVCSLEKELASEIAPISLIPNPSCNS